MLSVSYNQTNSIKDLLLWREIFFRDVFFIKNVYMGTVPDKVTLMMSSSDGFDWQKTGELRLYCKSQGAL